MSFVFGTGSARCGTKSLAVLFGQQRTVAVAHERHMLPWEVDLGAAHRAVMDLQKRPVRQVLTQGIPVRWLRYRVMCATIIGDIGPWYLPYADYLIKAHNAKIVCLKRDKEQTVESFLRQRYDHCSLHPAEADDPGKPLAGMLPKFDLPSRRANAEAYWEHFYAQADAAEQSHPESFRIFDIDTLNNEDGQRRILSFVGVPDHAQQPVRVDRRYALHACTLFGGDGGDGKDVTHG